MDIRKAGIMVSAGLGGLLLAAALGCSGKMALSAPVITGYKAAATAVVDGSTYQVAAVGSTVTIEGLNFNDVAAVSFAGYQAASYHVDSATQIRAVVPDDAVSGQAVVDNSGGSSRVYGSVLPLLIQPQINSMTAAAPGAVSTLDGYGLRGPASVTFTGASAAVTPTYIDSNTLTVLIPSDATAGTVVLTVNGLTAATWYATVDGSGNLSFSATETVA